MVPPVPFLTPGGSGVLADLARIGGEFRMAWLPYFCRSLGKGIPALRNSIRRLKGGYHFYPRFSSPRLTGQVLADVVQRKGATAGSLDGWGWRS